MRRRHLLMSLLGLVAVFGTACVGPASDGTGTAPSSRSTSAQGSTGSGEVLSGSLEILLTNDDGWNAPGITAMYQKLVAAGHDVTLVAPAKNQSGVSAAIEYTGKLRVRHPSGDPDVYSVSTTPAGCVLFGLNEVFAQNPPDLVISGTNVGANVGFDTNFSGTVGAAVVASGMYGVPAIAVSTAIEHGDAKDAAYAETASLVVELLEAGMPVLRDGTVLNINYPVLPKGTSEPKGIRVAPMAQQSAAAFNYRRIDEDTYEIVPGRSEAEPAAGTDAALLEKGYVTVTLLDANRTINSDRRNLLEAIVGKLE